MKVYRETEAKLFMPHRPWFAAIDPRDNTIVALFYSRADAEHYIKAVAWIVAEVRIEE